MPVLYYFAGIFLSLVPLIFGIAMKVRPPLTINRFYGLRTKITTSSEEVWAYSNDLFSFCLIVFSIVEFFIYSLIMVLTHYLLVGYDWVIMLIGLALAILTFHSAAAFACLKAKRFVAKNGRNRAKNS